MIYRVTTKDGKARTIDCADAIGFFLTLEKIIDEYDDFDSAPQSIAGYQKQRKSVITTIERII